MEPRQLRDADRGKRPATPVMVDDFFMSDCEDEARVAAGECEGSFSESSIGPMSRHSSFYTCEASLEISLRDKPIVERL